MSERELLERLVRERLLVGTERALGVTGWSNGPADVYGAHAHGYDKVLVAETGSIVFELPDHGESVELEAGDRLDLPAGTRHAAVVGPRGVACLEAHLAAGSLGPDPHYRGGWWGAGGAAEPGIASPQVSERAETAPRGEA